MNEQMKPCPFCSSSARTRKRSNEYWEAVCLRIRADTEAEAIGKWNERPIEDALREDSERLDFLIGWLGLHEDLNGSGIRDWDDAEDARRAIDAARAVLEGSTR